MSAALAAIAPASSILFTNTSLEFGHKPSPRNSTLNCGKRSPRSSFALLRRNGSSFEVAQILRNEIAADEFFVGLGQALCDRPRYRSGAEIAAIQAPDAADAQAC